MRTFLGTCRELIENTSSSYRTAYLKVFVAIGDSLLDVDQVKDEADIQQAMFNKVSKMSFEALYKRVCMHIDAESAQPKQKAP